MFNDRQILRPKTRLTILCMLSVHAIDELSGHLQMIPTAALALPLPMPMTYRSPSSLSLLLHLPPTGATERQMNPQTDVESWPRVIKTTPEQKIRYTLYACDPGRVSVSSALSSNCPTFQVSEGPTHPSYPADSYHYHTSPRTID